MLRDDISPPLDQGLADLLLREYESLEARFFFRDWEPATLDGGQFCEVVARCMYHIDSGVLNATKPFDECLSYVEDDALQHHFPSRRDALTICRALRLVYRFRSKRGAIHIHPDYTANEMDAGLVVSVARWVLCELVRIFWTGDPVQAAEAVAALVAYRVPPVFRGGAAPLVQVRGLEAWKEVLLLLAYAGNVGATAAELRTSILKHRRTAERAIEDLKSRRLVTTASNQRLILTDSGRLEAGVLVASLTQAGQV